MLGWMFSSGACVALLLGLFAVASLDAQDGPPVILTTHADKATQQVLITGFNFGSAPQLVYAGYAQPIPMSTPTTIVAPQQ